MKNQVIFSSKDKSKKLKCCLLQFLFGALRVYRNDLRIIKYFHTAMNLTIEIPHCEMNFQMKIQSCLKAVGAFRNLVNLNQHVCRQ